MMTDEKYTPEAVEANIFEFLWNIHLLHLEGGDSGDFIRIHKRKYSELKAKMYELYIPNWERLNQERR